MKKYRVNVNGTAYEVEIEEMTGAPAAAPVTAPAAAPAPTPAAGGPPAVRLFLSAAVNGGGVPGF